MGQRSAAEMALRADIEAHPPLMDAAVREGLALAAIERANLPDPFPHPEDLAEALGYVLLRTDGPRENQLAFDDGVISVAGIRWPLLWLLAVAHEVAECLIAGHHHSHGDVQLLSLALVMPSDVLDLLPYYVPWCPPWAVEIRREHLEEMAGAA